MRKCQFSKRELQDQRERFLDTLQNRKARRNAAAQALKKATVPAKGESIKDELKAKKA